LPLPARAQAADLAIEVKNGLNIQGGEAELSHGSFGRREGVSRLNTINSSHYGFYVTDTFGLVWPICSVRR
jgi:hypothetical protein